VQNLFAFVKSQINRRKSSHLHNSHQTISSGPRLAREGPPMHQIQRILHERKIFAPIWENGFIRGVGPRVEEPALALIPAFPYSAPYEDVRLKP